MKVAFVLSGDGGGLRFKVRKRSLDRLYCHSSDSDIGCSAGAELFYFNNAQTDLDLEFIIVERFISRALGGDFCQDDYYPVFSRAIQLSDVRLEARAFLNSISILSKFDPSEVEEVVYYSSFISLDDVELPDGILFSWELVGHERYINAIPGGKCVYLLLEHILNYFSSRA